MIIHRLADTTQNRAALQDLFNATPAYYLSVTGKVAAPNEAEIEFVDLPLDVNRADQYIFGFYLGDELIGCAGMLRRFRSANKVMLGLLLIAEKYQGQGHGARGYAELEKIIASWPGIDTVRIGVVETNHQAFTFWRKRGFFETGEKREKYPPLIADIIVMEKNLGEKNDIRTG
jgi:ribosomal protein S18 acetylase RimI-like enzyme